MQKETVGLPEQLLTPLPPRFVLLFFVFLLAALFLLVTSGVSHRRGWGGGSGEVFGGRWVRLSEWS